MVTRSSGKCAGHATAVTEAIPQFDCHGTGGGIRHVGCHACLPQATERRVELVHSPGEVGKTAYRSPNIDADSQLGAELSQVRVHVSLDVGPCEGQMLLTEAGRR